MSDNLYQTPNSNIPPAPDSSSEPRKVATANGWRWLVDAKGYFLASPGIWFGSMLVVGLILMIVALIPVIMAYWFAPALVMLRKKSAIDAMRLSFKACTINIVPFLVYGLGGLAIMLVFMLLASLFVSISIVIAVPLIAIGYLAFIAIIVASTYTSFNDIFPSVENEELEPMPQDPDQMIA